MIEQDTIKLLRECDAGIKMGVSSIDDVMDYAYDTHLKKCLLRSKDEHLTLQKEAEALLKDYHDDGKEPNIFAQGMSWMKANTKLILNESDSTIADLMTEGGNMGIKSLTKYLNQYQAADEKSKTLTKKIIDIEETLVDQMKEYL